MNSNAFDLYEMSAEREKRIWTDCVFVFDSSALLDFYFSPKSTREEIYKTIFLPNQSRLWIPGHVQFEYLKNRKKIVNKPVSEKYEPLKTIVSSDIAKFIKQIESKTIELHNQIKNKDTHPHFDDTEINTFLGQLKKFQADSSILNAAVNKRIDDAKKEIENLLLNDDVLQAFENFFSVGRDFSYEEIYGVTIEGHHRYKYLIPPGYEDLNDKEKKGTQIFGDLIIWKQILEYSKDTKKAIVFICNDLKEDWCHLDKKATEKRIESPREELIKEMYDFSKTEFWMYNLPQFLYNANKYLGTKINEDDIQSIANEIQSNEPQPFLELELIWIGNSRSPRGMSDKNPVEVEENGRRVMSIGAGIKPIIFWELDWRFDIRVHNNSNFPAFNVQIESEGSIIFSYLEIPKKVNHIKPLDYLTLKAGYTQHIEDIHTVADDIIAHKIPENLEGLSLKITYLNENRNKYVTIMKIENQEVTNIRL